MGLILASQSPRRKEMLAWLGLPFVANAAHVDETPHATEKPEALVVRLAQTKARAVQADGSSWVLGGDTIVVLDGRVLGKPCDTAEAREMLSALRGREHGVLSALTLRHGPHLMTRVVHAQVWMREYTAQEIEAYIATGDPLDKAGAYAIQHPVFRPVNRVEVCYAAVVGFPLCALRVLLHEAGFPLHVSMPEMCFHHFGYVCPRIDEGREA